MAWSGIYKFLESIESYDSDPPEFIMLEIPKISEDDLPEQDKALYGSIMKALVVQFISKDSLWNNIPAISFLNKWKHTEKQDISSDDLLNLKALEMQKIPLHVRTRLQDILWIMNRHYPSAIGAIEGYRMLYQKCFSVENWVDCISLIERVVSIARSIKSNGKKEEILSDVYKYLKQFDGCDEPVLFIKLLSLIINEEYGDPNEYLQLLSAFCDNYNGSLIEQVEESYKLEQKCFRWKKDKEAELNSLLRQAEYYVDKAVSLGINEHGIWLASDLLKKAYKIYKNNNMNKQAESVLKQLDCVQGRLSQFYKSYTVEVDLQQPMQEIMNRLQVLSPMERLIYLILATPILRKKEIIDKIENEKGLFSTLGSTEIKDNKGKTIAKLPPLWANTSQEYEKNLELHIYFRMAQEEDFKGYILLCIKQMILEFSDITRDMISILIENNAMIPDGREEQVLSALTMFFEGKELEGLYILVPQVEHMLRTLADKLGGTTTKIVMEYNDSDCEEELSLRQIFNIHQLKEAYDENLLILFRSMMIEAAGDNFRNRIAHGLLGTDNLSINRCTYFFCFVMRWLSFTAPKFYQFMMDNTSFLNRIME